MPFALPRAIFFLVVEGPRSKEQLGAEFWPDASPSQLKGRFGTAIHQLRKTLGDAGWILYRDGLYSFDRTRDHWLDADEFRERLELAEAESDVDRRRAAENLRAAIRLCRGTFLEGVGDSHWVLSHRERFLADFRRALNLLGDLHIEEGDATGAVPVLRRALELDDLDESVARRLAEALTRSGRRAAALRELDDLSNRLEHELSVPVSASTRALRGRIERGEPI